MKIYSLNGPWQGVCIKPDGSRVALDAVAPGSSIADLIRAGELPGDIFYRDNAAAVEKFEYCDYEYSRTFEFEPDGCAGAELVFKRLDTYCDIYLNGEKLLSTDDEHIPHRVDVKHRLRGGENTLRLYFHSPVRMVEGRPKRAGAFTTERMHTRRTQCTYGWDWVARLISCGINGDVELRAWDGDELLCDGVYVYTKNIDEDSAGIGVDVEFTRRLPRRTVTLRVKDPEGNVARSVRKYVSEPFVRFSLDIPAPRLWYPLGYGDQPIYTAEILDGDSVVASERFGIRTVKIMQLPDAPGTENYEKCLAIKNEFYDFNEEFSGFILKVNGVRILCKGANWVPEEPFCHGDTNDKITRALELAKEMGLNMLRVWGGGTFVSDHFLDECSRLGIMVTHDFLMACGQYPEDEDWFIAALAREAEHAARAMRSKACLMWWSGDNENAVNGCDTDENYMGRRSALEGVAPALYRLDPYREFLPSSPYGGNKYASNTVGTTHNTQYLGDTILPYMLSGSCDDYKEAWKNFRARFVAEEPQLGAISEGSLRRFMTVEDIYGPDDYMWKFHTKSNPGLKDEIFDISTRFAAAVLGDFTGAEDRFFKLRYIQYEWIRITLEQLRREMWFQSGVIYWMLNDCWPAASGWAIIDYYNKPKDGFYAFKRCARRAMISLDHENGVYRLYACNEGGAIPGARFVIRAVRGASARTLTEFSADMPAAAASVVFEGPLALEEGEFAVADMECAAGRDRAFFRPGALNIAPCHVEFFHDPEKREVTVTAREYVHAVELEAGAVFEDNCFSLLPGETRRVGYRGDASGGVKALACTLA